ncbi:methyltransferase-like protein [Dinothrombium tinctorium]|uniref:Acetylserotonin O-methyltransferase n=1 Tax=Dinothrombium tinctorium TaxID=1965070 RepID=A0A443RIW2_9ACAR|nr:methyltransferase-like protein [Dinothrombium tinctorium]
MKKLRNDVCTFEEVAVLNKLVLEKNKERTGETPFIYEFKKKFFDYLNEGSHCTIEDFMKLMQEYTKIFQSDVTSKYDFSKFKHIVDVGGNDGTFLVKILQNTPSHVHGTVYDLPEVAKKAAEKVAKHNLSGRCKIIDGSFLESVPEEGDCYILKYILNDWNDKNCVSILRNISKQMKADSKLLIIQQIDSEEGDIDVVAFDYIMLLLFGGCSRKLSQFESLLSNANLKLSRLISLGKYKYSMLEAVKELNEFNDCEKQLPNSKAADFFDNSLRTGESPISQEFGLHFFDYLNKGPHYNIQDFMKYG